MKRFLYIFISLAAFIALCAGMRVFAVAAESDGQCGENVYYTFNADSAVLTISGSGAMYDFAAPGASSPFAGDSSIKSVVVEKGVSAVGEAAFTECTALESAALAETVTSIGTHAFRGCDNLGTVKLLSKQTAFGEAVFPQQAVLQCYYGADAATYAATQNLKVAFFDRTVTYDFTVALNAVKFDYTGKAIKPTAVVKDGNGKTIANQYYTLTYDAAPGAIGMHSVKLKFTAPYVGSKTLKYAVVPKYKYVTETQVGVKTKTTVYAYDSVKKSDVVFNDVSTFSSSDHTVALVSKAGSVLGVGVGQTTITVNTGDYVIHYTLNVKAPSILINGAVQQAKTAKIEVPPGAAYS